MGKNRDLYYIHNCTKSDSGNELGGYDRNGQWRHCDSNDCES